MSATTKHAVRPASAAGWATSPTRRRRSRATTPALLRAHRGRDHRPDDPHHPRGALSAHLPADPGAVQPERLPAAAPRRHGRHVHDDLRDHGHRPQHRGRVRRSARPRLCRVLRDRRLHRGVLRLAALRERQHRPVLERRRRLPGDPPAVLDRPAGRGRSSPRRSVRCWALRRCGCAATTWRS